MFQRRPEQGYKESFPIKVEIDYANRKRTETGTYALRKDSITKQYIYYYTYGKYYTCMEILVTGKRKSAT